MADAVKTDKKERYQTGRVCDQKFASAKNQWIIPREFHSSLITAVKDRLSPRSSNSRLSEVYLPRYPSTRSVYRTCYPVLLLVLLLFHAIFSRCNSGVVCLLAVANGGLEKHLRPGRRSFCFLRAISLSRHHLHSQSERYKKNVLEAGSCKTNTASGAPRAELFLR